MFLHVNAVDHESIGRFALPIDGKVPRVEIAGWVDASRDACHDD